MEFLGYPKCSTCKKAQTWLKENGIICEMRDIKTNNPSKEELKKWQQIGNIPLKKFFNTSGLIYKEKNLKEKLPNMSEEEQYNLLASDGMLVKRPIIVTENFVLLGFKQDKWKEAFE